jgi:hypothetical protein
MTLNKFTESVVEEATLEWLEGMGYTVLHDPKIASASQYENTTIRVAMMSSEYPSSFELLKNLVPRRQFCDTANNRV